MRMNIEDIIIQDSFKESVPNQLKMQLCRFNWLYWGGQDRKIVVTKDNTLIDGYIMYLILKEFNEKIAIVKKIDKLYEKDIRNSTNEV